MSITIAMAAIVTFIREVQDTFDVELLADIAGDDRHTVFYLGMRPELGAGLRGTWMTPAFDKLEDLEAFCKRNIHKFREYTEDDPIPDATSWE